MNLLKEKAPWIYRFLGFGSREKSLQEALLEANLQMEMEFNHLLFDTSPAFIVAIGLDGRTIKMNRALLEAVEYTAEEVKGTDYVTTFVPEEDREKVLDKFREIVQETKPTVNENRVRSRSGRLFWVEWHGRRARHESGGLEMFVGVGINITERRQAEEELRVSENRFRAIFEQAGVGISLVTPTDGRFVRCNRAQAEMLGYDMDELCRLTMQDISLPGDMAENQARWDKLIAGELARFQVEKQFRHKNGQPVWSRLTATVIRDAQGGVQFMVGMVEAIGERKRAEMALRVLNETLEQEVIARTQELQAALVRAEAADRIKSAFLATMSHELRTPLNSIIGFTGILLQGLAGPLNPEQAKQLGMVRNSARHLLELINDVLDLSKIEAGQLEVRSEPFDVRISLERVTALVKPLADKKGLALNSVLPPELGEMVSDRRRVEQILLNLLNNAIKFTDKGSVTLAAERIVDFQPTPEAPPRTVLRLRVKDTGIGIKAEDLATLFRPFRQIDTGLSRQHEGSGLGLVICRRLATLLGGEISAASEWSTGSEFTVTFPLQKPSTP